MEEVKQQLDLIDQAGRLEHARNKEVMDDHLDASDRIVGRMAAQAAIKLAGDLAADPTP